MKKTLTTLIVSISLATAIGCSKEKAADKADTPTETATKSEPAAKVTPTNATEAVAASKLLVLKFHHDS